MKFGAIKALIIRPRQDDILNQDHVQGILRDRVNKLRSIVNDIETTVDEALRTNFVPKQAHHKRIQRTHK